MDATSSDDRSQRGATLVQYALVVVLIGLAVLAAVATMGSGSKEKLHAAGNGVHTEGASGGGGSGGSAGSGGSSGGSDGPPVTTAPTTTATPTTAPPATTTTAPPTTTTTTTTTTTAAPKSAAVSFTSSQAIADSTSRWHARTTVQVRGPSGEGVAGAQVELLIEGWSATSGGGTRRSSQVVTVATGTDGQIVVDTATAARTGTSRVNSITIKVQGATVPSAYLWSGATPSTSIDRI